jgi:hypothetical protein
MFFTLASHIAEVENDLPPALVSKDTLGQVKELSSLFPYDISRDIGFESHLTQKGGNVDFLFSVKNNSPGSVLLSKQFPVFLSALPETGLENWRYIHRFSEEWNDPGSMFNQYVDTIWFEFDHDGGFSPENPKFFMGTGSLAVGSVDSRAGLVSRLFGQLSQTFPFKWNASRLSVNFLHCIDRLPPNAKLYHIGIHLKGEISGLRFVLVNIGFESLLHYLEEIRWPGNFEKLRILLDSVSDRFDYFVYNIDVGESVCLKLGIECYLSGMPQPPDDARWSSNLGWMVENGWCLPEKKEGLLGYSGNHDVEHFYRLNYRNSLNHLKIVFNENMVETVKAYFGTYIRSYTTAGYK